MRRTLGWPESVVPKRRQAKCLSGAVGEIEAAVQQVRFVTMAEKALSRLKALPRAQRELTLRTDPVEQLAMIDGLSFGNGVIEVELASRIS